MIGYDDEWFAKEIRVELFTIASVSRYMFEYADGVGVSIFNANATGLVSCRMHALKPFCLASTSRTVSFC